MPISGPPVTPNQVRWLEDGLTALARHGPDRAGEAVGDPARVSGFVRNEATLAADIAEAVAASGAEVMPGWSRLLRRVTDAERFPALHRAMASEAFDQDDRRDEFVFGLERVLDGAALIAREARSASRSARSAS